MMKSNLVDLELRSKYETEKAILVVSDSDKEVWLPKSKIEYEHKTLDTVIVTLPEWLAIEKELV